MHEKETVKTQILVWISFFSVLCVQVLPCMHSASSDLPNIQLKCHHEFMYSAYQHFYDGVADFVDIWSCS